MSRSLLLVLVCGFAALVACSGHDAERVARKQLTASTPLPSTGFVPYPVRVDATGQPVPGPNGAPVPAWDGTLADLLAADAFALCSFGRTPIDDADEADQYLSHLIGRMEGAQCGPSLSPPLSRPDAWLAQRQDPDCNVNTSTLEPAVLAEVPVDEPRYQLPPSSSLPLGGPIATRILAYAETQREVRVAQLNVCMAMRLRNRLVSADTLVASGREQLELLEVIRQRAQIAMHYLALMGMSFASPDPRPDDVFDANQVHVVLRAWARTPPASSEPLFRQLGDDLAIVTQLYIGVVHELARLINRRAGARADTSDLTRVAGKQQTSAEITWGPGAWRNRLHNLLYGGDPLGTAMDDARSFNSAWGTQGGFAPSGRGLERFVSEDARAPEIGVLVGLAREADSFYLPTSEFVPDAADFIYRDVEAHLLRLECLRDDPLAACNFDVSSPEVPPLSDFESSLLWQDQRVHPDHASSLARMLLEGTPRFETTAGSSAEIDKHGSLHFLGQHETVSSPPGLSPTSTDWLHLDPQFDVAPLENAVLASGYHGFFGAIVPSPIDFDLYQVGRVQGFVARLRALGTPGHPGASNLALRYTGSVSALAGTRDALLTGSTWAATASMQAQEFFAASAGTIKAITTAIGQKSVTVRARRTTQLLFAPSGCPEWDGAPPLCFGMVHQSEPGPSGTNLVSEVSVVLPSGTGPAELVALNLGDNAFDTGLHTTAAIDPDFQSFGGYTSAQLDAEVGLSPVVAVEAFPEVGLERRTYEVRWPADPNVDSQRRQQPTLLLRSQGPTSVGYVSLADAVTYQTLNTDELSLFLFGPVYRTHSGRYVAYGGTLGALAQTSRARLADNWVQPLYDGFGLPFGWIPPTSPELLGAAPGEPATAFYLRTARQAAEEATSAVEEAVENLIAEEADQQLLSAAEEKAQTIPELERRKICGDQLSDCDVTLTRFPLEWPGATSCPLGDWCDTANETMIRAFPPEVLIFQQVADTADAQQAPLFQEYQGGSLQLGLIDQWVALKAILDFVSTADSQIGAFSQKYDAAGAQLLLAQASANAAEAAVGRQCSPNAFIDAFSAGWSGNGVAGQDTPFRVFPDLDKGSDGLVHGFEWDFYGAESKSWSPGPLYAQATRCEEARAALPIAQLQPLAATLAAGAVVAEAQAWLATQVAELNQRVGALSASTARIQGLFLQGDVAARAVELDVAFQSAGRTTTFGTSRRFHHFDLWRARALLENARRLSATARRAIEAHFVVDLSTLHEDEPFVSSPATWADEVYDFDLDAPAAVGLATVPGGSDAVFPNKLIDYVRNLELFVQGYAVARPTSVADRDSEVLTLIGPDVRELHEIDNGDAIVNVEILSFDSRAWLFHCPDSDTWVAHPGLGEVPVTSGPDSACGAGSAPDRARVAFRLDPWGRINGREADSPFTERHNTRWRRLVVNVVGTGVRDCTLAEDPLTCYSQGFIRYDLRHVGPTWVTNYEQQWRALTPSAAQVEDGKAIALEEFLDPLANGWSQPFVAEAARLELVDRPLGGAYELDLILTPDVRIDRIQRIQLLAETDYWVRQN